MSDARIAAEAFALTSDPGSYVPSPEREHALTQMASALGAGSVPCLEGPTGIGKTLMLQLLAQRVSDRFDPLYVPYPMLSTPELCTFVIGLLGHDLTPDPEATLLRIATERAERGRPLLLLIDDATSLPPDTARGLAALRAQAAGSLQLALAGIGGKTLLDATAAFRDTLMRVRLEERIPRAELRDYVAAQLDHASAPASLRRAFDDTVLEELERAASGNPRRLHLAAQSILRRAETRPPPIEPVPFDEHVEPRAAAAAEPPSRQPEPAPPPPPRPEPPAAPPRTATPVAPPIPAEPIGEYRVVRKRPSAVLPEPAPPVPPARPLPPPREVRVEPPLPPPREVRVEPPLPPPREVRVEPPLPPPPLRTAPTPALPPAEVDLTLAATSMPAAPLPTPPWQEPTAPVSNRAGTKPATPPAAERVPRRIPSLPIFLAVAIASAGLGFVLASRLQRSEPAAPTRTETTTVERTPAPAPAPTPAVSRVEKPIAEALPPTPQAQPMPAPAPVAPAPLPTALPAPPPAQAAAPAPAPAAAPAPAPARAAPGMIEISINASPWALIEIDGREVGETPLGGVAVERGPHRFLARFPDGRTVERTVEIDAAHRTLVFE